MHFHSAACSSQRGMRPLASRWRRIGGPHTVVVPAPVFEGREEKEERDVGGF